MARYLCLKIRNSVEIILSISISLVIGFIAGNFRREVTEKIESINRILSSKKDKPVETEGKSVFIDPFDPAEEAKRQYAKQMEDLNGYE